MSFQWHVDPEQMIIDLKKKAEQQAKRIEELESALTDLFAMMDERLLVRNIENDDDPLWSLHALNFTRRLQKAHKALAAVKGKGNAD